MDEHANRQSLGCSEHDVQVILNWCVVVNGLLHLVVEFAMEAGMGEALAKVYHWRN